MTPVYSGGLVYEYSQEESMYGLVTISGSTVSERPDFGALMQALKDTPAPTGDGGYKSDGQKSQCPPQSSTWLPGNDALPAIPDGAMQYMTNGAGKGPGLKGNNNAGSQNAGGASTATAIPGSGKPTTTASAASQSGSGSASSASVPVIPVGPLVCGIIVVLSSLLGASLL